MNSLDPLSIIVGIVFSIAANILTIPVQKALFDRLNFNTKKKLQTLRSELTKITEYYNERSKLYLRSASVAFVTIAFMSIGDAIWSLVDSLDSFVWSWLSDGISNFAGSPIHSISYQISIFLATMSYLVGALLAINHVRMVTKVVNYTRYKSDTEARIQKLENQVQAKIVS